MTTHSENTECCVECYGGLDGCEDMNCSCHHPTEDWEEWVRTLANSDNPRDIDLLVAKIKVEFAPTASLREKIEKERVGKRPTWKTGDPQWWDECSVGYNQAIDDILSLLPDNNNGI